MEFPLCDFNLRDLKRELTSHALSTEGSKQELYERLMEARDEEAEAQAQGFVRPGRRLIQKFGGCVQPDDFTEIACMTDREYDEYSRKLQWRLKCIQKTYDRRSEEYYHPGVLHSIDRTKTYFINMTEFWVRKMPYSHKIFVIFVTRTHAEEQRLLYARSFASLDLKTEPLITIPEIGIVLSNILMEIEGNGLENFVAIVADKKEVFIRALAEANYVNANQLPQILYDTGHLHLLFEKLFCAQAGHCLGKAEIEPYEKSKYPKQLERIQKLSILNADAEAMVKEYIGGIPKVLEAMWKIKEHKGKPISLSRINNERLNTYGAQVQNDLPPITFDDCKASGLLQLILFDALWCVCDGPEKEEESYLEPAPETMDTDPEPGCSHAQVN